MEIMKLENKEERVWMVISENTIKIIDLPPMQKSLHIPPFCYKGHPISTGSFVGNPSLYWTEMCPSVISTY